MFWGVVGIFLFVLGSCSEEGSSMIIFPTSFPSPEKHRIDMFEVKHCYQKGIDAVQSVAGLVQNLLLQETINFATKNWVISPISLAAVFAQLLMGSRGEIRQILSDALSLGQNPFFLKMRFYASRETSRVRVSGWKATPWPSAARVAQMGEGLGQILTDKSGQSGINRGRPSQLEGPFCFPDPAILGDVRVLKIDKGEDFGKLEVHRQLGNLLRYLQHAEGDDYILLLNAVVFLQSEFPLKTTYKHALMDFYDTKIIPVDFSGKSMESLKKINEWVRNSTLGLFSDVLPYPLPPSTVSLMANVVYFKGAWELPFDPDYTQPGVFFIDQNSKVHVDYMYGEQQILYGNTSDFQLIGLPFKSREVVIYILLPNGKFSTRVAMKQLDAIASSARLEHVTLALPKFKITTTISVKNSISKYLRKKPTPSEKLPSGRSRRNFTRFNELEKYKKYPHYEVPASVRDNHFDMSGASDDLRFKIDDILHKVSVEVNEKGTEIVAITSTLVDHSGSDFIIRVNRPFLFFVRHEITLAHLFWGLVVNPGKTTKSTT